MYTYMYLCVRTNTCAGPLKGTSEGWALALACIVLLAAFFANLFRVTATNSQKSARHYTY